MLNRLKLVANLCNHLPAFGGKVAVGGGNRGRIAQTPGGTSRCYRTRTPRCFGTEVFGKTLWQTLRKMGWRFKKKSSRAAEQDRADVVVKRKDWHATQETVDAERLVFLDETGLKTNFTRPTCYIHVFIMCLATTFQDKSAPFHCHIP